MPKGQRRNSPVKKNYQTGGAWPFQNKGLRAGNKAREELVQLQALRGREQQLQQMQRKAVPGAARARGELQQAAAEFEQAQRRLHRLYLDFWELTKFSIPRGGNAGKEQWLIDWDINDIRNSLYLPPYYSNNPLYVHNVAATKDMLVRLQGQVRPYPLPPKVPSGGLPSLEELSTSDIESGTGMETGGFQRGFSRGPGQVPLPPPLVPGAQNPAFGTVPAGMPVAPPVGPYQKLPVFDGEPIAYGALPVSSGAPGPAQAGMRALRQQQMGTGFQQGGGYDLYDETNFGDGSQRKNEGSSKRRRTSGGKRK